MKSANIFFLINIVNKMEFRLKMKIFVDFPFILHDLWSQIYFWENTFCIQLKNGSALNLFWTVLHG